MIIIMGMAQARIGKISLKAGGAELRLLNRDTRPDGENYRGLIIKHARMIAENEADMVGFVLVGIFADGSFDCGIRLDGDAVVGRTMLPSYVADVLRREALIEPAVRGEI